MRNLCLFLFLALQCSGNLISSQNARPPALQQDSDMQSAYAIHYVVIAGESFSYNSLSAAVRSLSLKTRIPYEGEGLIYDPKLGLIWPSDSSAGDEMFAGLYYVRRYGCDSTGNNFLSLEMRDWYFNKTPGKSLKMVIVAGIYTNGELTEALKRLQTVRKYCPTAYLRKTILFTGCIH